ncbi:hypothetical protein FKR81_34475 [Lentzea tibetensis]|uniref:Uncharacterized protein n=1 Tax=Lentzea tibetensis TaxID=2591470 RepID=A0A563EJI2_9PSEU|nr:hypothetical protein [Lentzea tibetensis]TWP46910.1 hypothetical protein FKR81_34475 [Lentzea tibetensis]
MPAEAPFPARMHPHVDRVRSRTWARDKGFLDSGVWTPESFDAADYGLFAALTHPHAAPDALDLVADWHTWRFYADDFFAHAFIRTRNIAAAKAFVERLKNLGDPAGPVEEALADLLARSKDLPVGPLHDMLDSWLWELHNDVQGRVPDPVDFVEMRRRTSGAEFAAALARFATGAPPPGRQLTDPFADVVGLHNDVVSFDKDVVGEGTLVNAVLAVRDFFGGEQQDAVHVVQDLISARLRDFQDLAEDDHADALRSWIAGYFTWAARTGRYRGVTPPRRTAFHRPSGLGTAALLVR